MELNEILSHCDHTLLAQTATWEEIQAVIDDGIKYHTASVCIPPCFVQRAAERSQGRVKICTVIGYGNGYNLTEVKLMEAALAIQGGADEIDMVINLGWVKERKYFYVEEEIRKMKKVAGEKILKVIVETCFLTEEEKIELCKAVTRAGADYIKTSTGFGGGGATFEDIELFSKNIGPKVKMKAAGGIKSLEDAEKFIELGADRLGTSRIVKIAKTQ